MIVRIQGVLASSIVFGPIAFLVWIVFSHANGVSDTAIPGLAAASVIAMGVCCSALYPRGFIRAVKVAWKVLDFLQIFRSI